MIKADLSPNIGQYLKQGIPAIRFLRRRGMFFLGKQTSAGFLSEDRFLFIEVGYLFNNAIEGGKYAK